jgi:hypothetical protein
MHTQVLIPTNVGGVLNTDRHLGSFHIRVYTFQKLGLFWSCGIKWKAGGVEVELHSSVAV